MQHKQRGQDTTNSLSMGGIDLCFTCWNKLAHPRQQQYVAGLTRCDFCYGKDDVLRLTLKQSVRTGAKVTDKGRGSLALCSKCWQETGLQTMRRKPDNQTDPVRVFEMNARRVRS
jgi:hypothetical protein